jgi:hypothetical protein
LSKLIGWLLSVSLQRSHRREKRDPTHRTPRHEIARVHEPWQQQQRFVAENRRVAIPYMGIMAFRGTLICEWRDYFDRGLFDRLKAGETPPPEIAELLNRPAIP